MLFVAAMSHGWELLSFGVPLLQHELDDRRAFPELRLSDLGSISTRRPFSRPSVTRSIDVPR